MRYISIKEAKPGMELAYDIFDKQGRVLINGNRSLTEKYIEKLKAMGFSGIYIRDELSEGIELATAITPELRGNAIEAIERRDIDACCQVAMSIVEQILNAGVITLDLTDLRSFDDFTYAHSVNVAVISCVVGIGLELDQEMLTNLVTAALLHDLGKLAIPPEIINKQGRLTPEEYEIVKSHPQKSYDMISGNPGLSAQIKVAVLSHHENVDGSGYPRGLTGDEQTLLTKILHITDVYDALVSKRSYKNPYSSYEAAEYLMGGCGILFDFDIVNVFLKYVPLYPKGTTVWTSEGDEGIIYDNLGVHNLRPIIKLYSGELLDLSDPKYLSVTIKVAEDIGEETEIHEETDRTDKSNVEKRKPHIVVTDDLMTNLQMIREILEPYYELTMFKSGQQTLSYFEKNGAPDLFIMDIDMPEISGIETVRKIRNHSVEGAVVPVLFVSSLHDKATVIACQELMASGYIVRPYNPTFIKTEIERILKGHIVL